MRIILIASFLIPILALGPLAGSVRAQETGSVQVVFRYVEVQFEEAREARAFMSDIGGTTDVPEPQMEIINHFRLPSNGGRIEKEMSKAKDVILEGHSLLRVIELSLEGTVQRMSDEDWLLELSFQVGEEAPFLVRQKTQGGGSDIFTQRTRSVGFTAKTESPVKSGDETVIHADMEMIGDKPVCRVFTVNVDLLDAEQVD